MSSGSADRVLRGLVTEASQHTDKRYPCSDAAPATGGLDVPVMCTVFGKLW
jgi:hypothetical protein